MALLSSRPLRKIHEAAINIALTNWPITVSDEERRANVRVAAVATFCRKKPMRARTNTGRLSQWPIVRATVCEPR